MSLGPLKTRRPTVTVAGVLAELASLGARVEATADGRLKIDAPAGALSDQLVRKVLSVRDEALRLLVTRQAAPPVPDGEPAPAPPAQACSPWDQAAADATLAEVGELLDGALAEGGRATTPSRRAVAEVYRRLGQGYHARRDPLLFEAPAAVARLLADWG
jgi:hypothetical protein